MFLQVKWWRLKLWLRPRQQGAFGLTAHVYEGTFMERQTGTDTAWTQTDRLPTVVLRCVIFYKQPAGVCIVGATEWHFKALQVVERLHVAVIRHQAGDVSRAEMTSINLRQLTPHLSAPGKKGHPKVTPEHTCNRCTWKRRASLIMMVADAEPVDLWSVLRHRRQGAVDGEQVIVHAVKSKGRSWKSIPGL